MLHPDFIQAGTGAPSRYLIIQN